MPFDNSVWFLSTFLCLENKGSLWLLLFLAVLSMAGSSPVSLLGLFWAILVDFGAGCAGDMGGRGGSSRRSLFWFSSEAFGALEMGSEFSNWDDNMSIWCTYNVVFLKKLNYFMYQFCLNFSGSIRWLVNIKNPTKAKWNFRDFIVH